MHDSAAFFSIIATIWIVVLAAIVGVHLFFGLCYKKIALNLGNVEDAKLWWIPIANNLILIRAAGRPDWWLIWSFVPIAGFVTSILVWTEVAQALGKSAGWGVVAAIFPLIGVPYLGFSEPEFPPPSLGGGEDDITIRWEP